MVLNKESDVEIERITHAMRACYLAGVVKECNESVLKKKVWHPQHNMGERNSANGSRT